MVNITDDIWTTEPTLRPEDEIVLKKLHDMLQSTADDLKLLSGELSKYHEPGVQVKSLPTPLDEDFNEKVHIEELVNAKFHGYKIFDKSQPTPANVERGVDKMIKAKDTDTLEPKKIVNNADLYMNQLPINRKPTKKNHLTISRTKIIQINDNVNANTNINDAKNGRQQKDKINKPIIAYKELSHKYAEPNIKLMPSNPLRVQNMPSINIRGELKEQKVLHLNIEPEAVSKDQNEGSKCNVGVISVQYKPPTPALNMVPTTNPNKINYPIIPNVIVSKETTRKFSKMSSCESSEADSHDNLRIPGVRKIRPYKATKTVIKLPSKQHFECTKNKRDTYSQKESAKHSTTNLEAWKKKLNAVYGCPTISRKTKFEKKVRKANLPEKKSTSPSSSHPIKNLNTLNNFEYIPYSKLTLGGVRVSDIEKELSDMPNKTDITLGPILNKIISRENSFHNDSPLDIAEDSPKILTTSDENLLREVLDIEKKVTQTLTKNFTDHNAILKKDQPLDDQDSYADDFEDEKSDYSAQSEKQNQLNDDVHSDDINLCKSPASDSDNKTSKSSGRNVNMQNQTYTRTLNLSIKKNVDVFEFVHNIDTQDTGTQSNTTQKISLKETQTSPRNDKYNVQPIHNDLWPSIDPKGEVEKLFQLEKDFIKKLIVDEYGDLLEKNLSKPSTSKAYQTSDEKNLTASQKNTQTSPAHVKSVMTSPTRTKTRTTSPLALSLTMDRQTSPIIEELKVNIENGDDIDLSINLSSPRFSLRLPQTSLEVISNLELHGKLQPKANKNYSRDSKLARNYAGSSSSSTDGNYSSSDISSLGEVAFKLKRLKKLQVPTLSELSSSASLSKCSSDYSDAIIPLRSEGEISLGQVNRRKSNKNIKSEGEASVGRLN